MLNKNKGSDPFPFRFTRPLLAGMDVSQWREIPSLKGISCLTEEELAAVSAAVGSGTATDILRTTPTVYAITTNFNGRPDQMNDTDYTSTDTII